MKCYLPNYEPAQTRQYIERYLKYAGAQNEIFSDAAVEEVYRVSAGCTRMINKLCLHCLIYGTQHQRTVIDDSVVQLIAKEEL